MKVYIAASWKHEHAVRLLTEVIRAAGHDVLSFVEKAGRDEDLAKNPHRQTLDDWVWSDAGLDKFRYDTGSATSADRIVYIGPSGTDAWAEVGAAWAAGVPVYGLWAKGEPSGLMRRMVTWFDTHTELVKALDGHCATLCRMPAVLREQAAKC